MTTEKKLSRCETFQSMMKAYMEGDLPDRLYQALEQHLDECEACNEALVLAFPRPEPPPLLVLQEAKQEMVDAGLQDTVAGEMVKALLKVARGALEDVGAAIWALGQALETPQPTLSLQYADSPRGPGDEPTAEWDAKVGELRLRDGAVVGELHKRGSDLLLVSRDSATGERREIDLTRILSSLSRNGSPEEGQD